MEPTDDAFTGFVFKRCRLENAAGRFARWVTGPQEAIERITRERGPTLLYDAKGNPLIVFEDAWTVRWVMERETDVRFHEIAP